MERAVQSGIFSLVQITGSAQPEHGFRHKEEKVKKRPPEIQPAHKGSRITVAQAARAFRLIRGSDPKPDLWGPDDPIEESIQPPAENGRSQPVRKC